MKRPGRWLQPAAFIAGLIAAAASFLYGRTWMLSNVDTEPILVAARYIPAFTDIRETDLIWRTVPRGGRDPSSITDLGHLIGTFTQREIYSGEQIRREAIGRDPLMPRVGERLVSIPTNYVRSVGGEVRRGHVVDVYWTSSRQETELLVPAAVVVSVRGSSGQELHHDAQVAPAMIVLKVNFDAVAGLGKAIASGDIFLAKVSGPEALATVAGEAEADVYQTAAARAARYSVSPGNGNYTELDGRKWRIGDSGSPPDH